MIFSFVVVTFIDVAIVQLPLDVNIIVVILLSLLGLLLFDITIVISTIVPGSGIRLSSLILLLLLLLLLLFSLL